MSFSLPSFRDILTRAQTDLGGFSNGTVPRRSIEYVLARMLAGVSKGLYGYLTYILKQVFFDTADETNFWHWFTILGPPEGRKAAEFWAGTYEFTGTNGTNIPDGTQLQRPDGQLYETDGAVTISGGVAEADIIALEAGADGNNEDGQVLSLALPVAGVDPDGEVTSTTTTGSDLESREDGQARLFQHLRTPPSGGGPGDYVRWALEVPGVTRAWEFANLEGPNSVSVAFVRDGDGSGSAIVPDSGERATVLAHLQTRAPITVTVYVITLTAVPLDVTLSSLDPDNADVRAAIEEELTDLLEREAEPGGTLALSKINEAISAAAGEEDHATSIPAADITYATDEIGIMGTLT